METIRTATISKITQQMREIGFMCTEEAIEKLVFENRLYQRIEVPLVIVGE